MQKKLFEFLTWLYPFMPNIDEEELGMMQVWVGQKLVNVTFYNFLRCPIFALGPRFHKNRNILEVVHYNIKFTC